MRARYEKQIEELTARLSAGRPAHRWTVRLTGNFSMFNCQKVQSSMHVPVENLLNDMPYSRMDSRARF